MGAKGKKSREKNYRAAHGGYTALPPPPNPSKVDALPSKLRQIMSFTRPIQQQNGPSGLSKDFDKKKRKDDDGHAQNNTPLKDTSEVGTADVKQGNISGQLKAPQHTDSRNEWLVQSNANDKKKKKRKRKEVKDLRFDMEVDNTNSKLKRRERKKKYLGSKKKKHKTTDEEEKLGFPGQEKIKFGDIVKAPPKLAFNPKPFKNTQDASQERLRLRAIEDYRSRKGWTSRPGGHLPPPLVTSDP